MAKKNQNKVKTCHGSTNKRIQYIHVEKLTKHIAGFFSGINEENTSVVWGAATSTKGRDRRRKGKIQ